VESPAPLQFHLEPAFPNPFNAQTQICFQLPEPGWTRLTAMDPSGRIVAALLPPRNLPAGDYRLIWDASRVPAGMYWIRLASGDRFHVRPLIIVR
jgi:hypothetical protein